MAGSPELKALIQELVPPNGESIGNQALLSLIRKRDASVADEDFKAARGELIEACVLGRGRGRGGSVYRVDNGAEPEPPGDSDEEETEDADDEFELAVQEAPVGRKSRKGTRSSARAVRRRPGPTPVLSYR